LLIKERQVGANLYLGYTANVHNNKIFCFFSSLEKEKDSDKNSCTIVSRRSELDIKGRLQEPYDIQTPEELYQLVLAALSKKYTTTANKELLHTLE